MGKSYQRGWVVSRGKKWYGYFRKTVFDPTTNQQKGDVISVVLGLKSQMKASEAREVLEREITKQTGQSGPNAGRVMNDSSVTFGWFVRNRFFPLKEAHWKEETAKVKKLLIRRDLIDPFDKTPLGNFDKFTLQVHLNNLAKTNSKDRVLQIRAYLRDIFAEAVDQDFLVKDPARKVTVPTQLRDTDRTTLTWWQLRGALSKLNLRDRILLELDMTNALRPWGKTRKSLGSVHVPKELADDLWLWKQRCPNPSPDAFIFPNKKGGFMDSNNYRNRVLHGLAQELELPKLTFQVIRRTIATLAQKKGTVKDIQGVLRHSRIATTTDVYMQEIPGSVQKTVDAISAELRLLPNLEEVTRGTSVLLPNATKLKSGVSASS